MKSITMFLRFSFKIPLAGFFYYQPLVIMPTCPQCDRPIASDALSCPHCRTALKAHGHPGMTLHRAEGDRVLCPTCVYDVDNTCNFPKRPQAKTCTLYQNIEAPAELSPSEIYLVPWWRKINRFWLAIALLIAISITISLL